MLSEKAELALKLADYLKRGEEPPTRLLGAPEACEGQLMTDAEIEQYIHDAVGTITVLRDQRSERLGAVEQAFFADLEFLASIGRIRSQDVAEIKDPENYQL